MHHGQDVEESIGLSHLWTTSKAGSLWFVYLDRTKLQGGLGSRLISKEQLLHKLKEDLLQIILKLSPLETGKYRANAERCTTMLDRLYALFTWEVGWFFYLFLLAEVLTRVFIKQVKIHL